MGERGTSPKSLMERSKGYRELGHCSAMCSRFDASGSAVIRCDVQCHEPIPLVGCPAFPFIGQERAGFTDGRKEENERQRKSFKDARSSFSSMWALLTW